MQLLKFSVADLGARRAIQSNINFDSTAARIGLFHPLRLIRPFPTRRRLLKRVHLK